MQSEYRHICRAYLELGLLMTSFCKANTCDRDNHNGKFRNTILR